MKKSVIIVLNIFVSCIFTLLYSFNFVYAEPYPYQVGLYIDEFSSLVSDSNSFLFTLLDEEMTSILQSTDWICLYNTWENGILFFLYDVTDVNGSAFLGRNCITVDNNQHKAFIRLGVNWSYDLSVSDGEYLVALSQNLGIDTSSYSSYSSQLYANNVNFIAKLNALVGPFGASVRKTTRYNYRNVYNDSSDMFNKTVQSGNWQGINNINISGTIKNSTGANYTYQDLQDSHRTQIYLNQDIQLNTEQLQETIKGILLNSSNWHTSYQNKVSQSVYYHFYITFQKNVTGYILMSDNSKINLYNQHSVEFDSDTNVNVSSYHLVEHKQDNNVDFNQDSNFYKDSSGTADKLENNNSKLDTSVKDYTDMENKYMEDMHSNFNDVVPSSDLLKQNGFLNSAKWVSSQFNQLVDVQTSDGSQPFKLMLFFSLILGIALIMIGKIRG